jgi:hypothetical protein
METEEGLAVIHQLLSFPDKYAWITALYYYASWYGNTHSFSELDKELQQFLSDQDRRWKMCLRVKRGIKDTSQPGAFSRNQLYFSGFVKVLRWLAAHEYDPTRLFIGKIAVEDIPLVEQIDLSVLKIPTMLVDKKKYAENVKEIIKVNKIVI